MTVWQMAAILGLYVIASSWISWLMDQRAARREARRAVLDQQLNAALRDLFEQRERHTKEQ